MPSDIVTIAQTEIITTPKHLRTALLIANNAFILMALFKNDRRFSLICYRFSALKTKRNNLLLLSWCADFVLVGFVCRGKMARLL